MALAQFGSLVQIGLSRVKKTDTKLTCEENEDVQKYQKAAKKVLTLSAMVSKLNESLARKKGLISSTAKLIQYPIVLAWAVTVHKFQGQTVANPQKVVIDLKSVFEAAQAYVMKSRVQELEQLYILEELPEEKIYANHKALTEIDRLLKVSINQNPTDWDKEADETRIKISFLNCRSMKNKFDHVNEE